MGMAASQARYLSLVARKTNVEWEGQQINQSRTALANKTAALFNQMLGMTVPDCPDCTDFTQVQYSFSDGLNASVIDKFYQLSTPDPEYNYVVTHHYNTTVYTGSVKKLTDPQVNFGEDFSKLPTRADINAYQVAIASRNAYSKDLETARIDLQNAVSTHPAGEEEYAGNTDSTLTVDANGVYTVKNHVDDTESYQFVKISPTDVSKDSDLIVLLQEGKFSPLKVTDLDTLKSQGVYYNSADKTYILGSTLKNSLDNVSYKHTALETYSVNTGDDEAANKAADKYLDALDKWNTANAAVKQFESKFTPTYVGNCELTELSNPLTEDELAELSQCIKDFDLNEYTTNLQNYFTNDGTGRYSPYDYCGSGVYKFTLNGVTQYTTLADLAESYINANDPPGNDIDAQFKLPYYSASYIDTPIEKTERALLETDGEGRFKSVRFESDSVKYVLNCETKVNEDAYNDAMNQYNHEVYKYEKAIADINAKTEIIQNQDRTLELRLKQLDTEQSALTNEIDAVKKVLKDNIEKSFKTFGE